MKVEPGKIRESFRLQKKTSFFIIVALLFLLSGCAKDHSPIEVIRSQIVEPEDSDSKSNPENQTFSDFEKVIPVESYQIQVLEPLQIEVASNEDFIDTWMETLPGATLSTDGQYLNWIPKNHQSGIYRVQSRKVIKKISVAPRDLSETIGPPQGYEDGDVGYIFIHGRGEEDLCKDDDELDFYWYGTPDLLAPVRKFQNILCYDGRDSVKEIAPRVARQILEADCGAYDRCITVTHSMGDMILEHILIHAEIEYRKTTPFADHHPIYAEVKNRILYNIAIGSAANGSKVANILENPKDHAFGQRVVGRIADVFGADNAASEDLQIKRATQILAPHSRDVGIPFYMVAGYSEKRVNSAGDLGLLAIGLGASKRVFNEDTQYALLDGVTSFRSRSDGAVAFRSSCGIASNNENDGPGTNASKTEQFTYCFQAKKKTNHYPWFVTNLNHSLVKVDHKNCDSGSNPCLNRFYSASNPQGIVDPNFRETSPPRVIRRILSSRKTDPIIVD